MRNNSLLIIIKKKNIMIIIEKSKPVKIKTKFNEKIIYDTNKIVKQNNNRNN